MTGISKDKNENIRILFVASDKKRHAVRLGKVTKKFAESIKVKIEALANALSARMPLDTEAAAWVGGIGDDLAAKLAAVGLIPRRESRKLCEFLAEYVAGREGDGHTKPATLVTIRRVVADLNTVLGEKADLQRVTVQDAERFKRFYQDKELAGATIYRRLKMAKMLFGEAVRLRILTENPFATVKGKNMNPTERRHYIAPADTAKLLNAANPTWRTIIALCRYAGLRNPSETLSLLWEHNDFAAGRMTVTPPKTEHLEGWECRVVPIFAALRPYLEEARGLAPVGEIDVIGGKTGDGYRKAAQGPGGWVNANLRTTFEKLVVRAGLEPWPRLFHNLRASAETDLMASHPIHVVTAWLGNTPKIALGHYLQTLEGDFEKAVRGGAQSDAPETQNPTQPAAARAGQDRTNTSEVVGVEGVLSAPVSSSPVLSECSGGQGGARTRRRNYLIRKQFTAIGEIRWCRIRCSCKFRPPNRCNDCFDPPLIAGPAARRTGRTPTRTPRGPGRTHRPAVRRLTSARPGR